jgi:flotillin
MISPIVIGVGAAIVLLIILFFMSYVKARPDEVVLVSGIRKQPKVISGRAGLRIPFLERADKLSLQLLNIDVKTANPVPTNDYINVTVDAVVTAKIGDDEKLIQAASQNFLNKDVEAIRAKIVDILEGNMREIVGQMQLVDLVSDRKQVSDNVLSNAKPDLERLGIVIQTFNIQNFRDEQGVIENLGVDKTSAIRKAAAISKANAERDILVAQSKAKREANDAAVEADLEIAKKQNGLAVAKADLKKQEDTKNAEADAAYEIQKQTQLKQINITAAEAEVARQEKLIEVREKTVAVTQKELEAKVLKTAEAEKQATILRAEAAREAAVIQAEADFKTAQKNADANLYQTQKKSEAELFKQQKDAEALQYSKERDAEATQFAIQKNAEAQRYQQEQTAEGVKAMAAANLEAAQADAKGIAAKGQAEGIAIRATGEAEAITIKAKGLSEAEALDKKADAMAKYGEAAKQDMQLEAVKTYFNVLPQIAGEISKPMEKIGNITMYGEGNTAKLTGDITKTLTQITNGLTDGLGINPTNILNSMLAKKLPESNN